MADRYVPVDELINTNIKRIKSVNATELDDDDTTIVRKIGATNVADIANDANGTAIATAVNGILAILVASGLMAAE